MDFKKDPKTCFRKPENMKKKDAREEIKALREGIEYHNYRYYVKNDPAVSDRTFDVLFSRLEQLETAFPDLQSPDSPTRRVGTEPVSRLKKTGHSRPMLSLNAVYDEKDISHFQDFIERNTEKDGTRYVLEPKFDGLSVEVVYENGALVYGATRGDGETGEDITFVIRTVKSVPLHLQENGKVPAFLSVRGEILLSKSGFQKLNRKRLEQGDDPFANPRNAASGLMRQLDPRNVAGKPFDIYFYEILDVRDVDFSTHWEELEAFHRWGLKVSGRNARATGTKEIKAFHTRLDQERDGLDYEIDGTVIKVDNYENRKKLGSRQRSPRWAIAWKSEPRQEETIVRDIVVQVGRAGMLTPVALLEPVEVGGVTISRATLHNEDETRKKDVRVGDTVKIVRAGDVIPEVAERVDHGKKRRGSTFSMPKKCPSCGSGVFWFCPAGLRCRAQLMGSIMHYASREAMNIEGLGEKTVKQLVERRMVHDIADLYHLTKDDFEGLEGFAAGSAGKLHEAVQSSKEARFDRFLYAIGIRHVGEHVARLLAVRYGSLDRLMKAGSRELKSMKEIGPEIA